jgi:hypothetical protein
MNGGAVLIVCGLAMIFLARRLATATFEYIS